MVDARFVSAILFVLLGLSQGRSIQPSDGAGNVFDDDDSQVRVLSSDSTKTDGEVSFAYELSDGQEVQQTIQLDPYPEAPEPVGIKVTGFYRFTAPNGNKYLVTYSAGKGGTKAKVELEPSDDMEFPTRFASAAAPPKPQEEDAIGCALRASLCG